MRRRAAAATLIMLGLVAACSSPYRVEGVGAEIDGRSWWLVRYAEPPDFFEQLAQRLVTVDLDEETGCVGAEGVLIVWPYGTEFAQDHEAVVLPDGTVVTDGTRLGIGGEDRGIPDVLERCTKPGLEETRWFAYWPGGD